HRPQRHPDKPAAGTAAGGQGLVLQPMKVCGLAAVAEPVPIDVFQLDFENVRVSHDFPNTMVQLCEMPGPPMAEKIARPLLIGTCVPPAVPRSCCTISPTREIPEHPATWPHPIMPPDGFTGMGPVRSVKPSSISRPPCPGSHRPSSA